MIKKLLDNQFLFSELIKRDFKKKYNGSLLGVLWSLLSPMIMVLAQSLVFAYLLGANTPHYTMYLFSGNIIFNFFREATINGMLAFEADSGIITKIKVPKYLFLLSKNVSALLNLCMSFIVYFIFCSFDGVNITWRFWLSIYAIVCLLIFNIGVGLILSALYVFFKDVRYLYELFCSILVYFSAIFYNTNSFPDKIAYIFYINPIYSYISFIRKATIYAETPSFQLYLLCFGYALVAFLIGVIIYRKNNKKFLYYL